MGYKYDYRTTHEIMATVEDLRKAVDKLNNLVDKMNAHSMEKALFPWVKATFDAIETVTKLPGLSDIMLDAQISAKRDNRASSFEEAKRKSARDTLRRKTKGSASAEPPKPRGRPRKKA
jgi:hypothetical protein